MPSHPCARQPLPLWARLAAFLGFLAVLAALLAPVSRLAEDVRTGKLGGVCSAALASAGNPASNSGGNSDSGSGQAPLSASHCDWCGSVALVLPPLALSRLPCSPGLELAQAHFPADLATSVIGLPFSRGPPRRI